MLTFFHFQLDVCSSGSELWTGLPQCGDAKCPTYAMAIFLVGVGNNWIKCPEADGHGSEKEPNRKRRFNR